MVPQFWLNLQTRFDLEVTEDRLAERLIKEVQVLRPNMESFKKPYRKALRITHIVVAPCAAFLLSRGFLFLEGAERSTLAGGGYAAAFGVAGLVMGLLAGGLSIISLVVSFSSRFK